MHEHVPGLIRFARYCLRLDRAVALLAIGLFLAVANYHLILWIGGAR